jgi:hypothetical protein
MAFRPYPLTGGYYVGPTAYKDLRSGSWEVRPEKERFGNTYWLSAEAPCPMLHF